MQDALLGLTAGLPAFDAQTIILAVLFGSVLLAVVGTAALLAPKDPVQRRFEQADRSGVPRVSPVLLRQVDDRATMKGWGRYVTPKDEAERSRMRLRLARAGYRSPAALRSYYLIRAGLGLAMAVPIATVYLAMSISVGAELGQAIGVNLPGLLWLTLLLVGLGFYLPPLWVFHRIQARQQAVRDGFPDALDMLQVSVESGLGLDSAIARVAMEIAPAQPIIAEEFALIGFEVRAGKSRDRVLHDMATRVGVDEVSSFVTVLVQSGKFGTSVADALRLYAAEMRATRMLRAEEKANKLPVKLSVAVVLCMLPAMFAVILGPAIIQSIRVLLPAMAGS